MNDRYLYRAKQIDNGEWVEGLTSYNERGEIAEIEVHRKEFLNYFCEIDQSTICQCTGLKDKNGKLIWENDIIKHYNDTSHPDKYDKGIVRWNDFNIRFERYSTEMKGNVCMNRDCVYEVIGNIFDNPELLEVGE